MALRLGRVNPRRKPLVPVPRPFSSSSSNPPFPPPPPPLNDPSSPATSPGEARSSRSPGSSHFEGIRERLQASHGQGLTPPPTPRRPVDARRLFQQPQPSSFSFSEIRQSLQSFQPQGQSRAGAAPPSQGGHPVPSLSDLLMNIPAAPAPQGTHAGAGKFDWSKIRQSLTKIDPQAQRSPKSPYLQPSHRIFQKEQGENAATQADGVEKDKDFECELMREYTPQELGKKLAELRPAAMAGKDGKEGFSLEELRGRIAKLVELEKKELDSRSDGTYSVFKTSLGVLKKSNVQKDKEKMQGIGMSLLAMATAAEPMRPPPQEELLERYFHPDHMSSEEKMKLELQRVRDEFKMSENDCGSARVQVAQLTVKIKHLSSVLHKKDKHSRKGLQDMVQRRKKYLKYLRRTDWDSYCLVLSKLGLRDVPEYKAPDYKIKSTAKAKSKKSKSKSKRKRKIKA